MKSKNILREDINEVEITETERSGEERRGEERRRVKTNGGKRIGKDWRVYFKILG